MKKEKEIVVISGFMGFTIGVCSMMFINIDKEAKDLQKKIAKKYKLCIKESII